MSNYTSIMALTKKDVRSVVRNKRWAPVFLVVPLVMVVFIPSMFILLTYFVPSEMDDLGPLLTLLPENAASGDMVRTIMSLLLNNIMPVFFMLIPVMSSSIMAASSFVGEKERRTLETLLYSPLSLKEIFRAKIAASFIVSMGVSVVSFIVMIVVVETETMLTMGYAVLPSVNWLVMMLLVSPAVSMIAIGFIVRGSAKAQTMEEAQQKAAFLVLPVILLIVGQFTGVLLLSAWILLGLGVALALIAALLLRNASGRLNMESILSK